MRDDPFMWLAGTITVLAIAAFILLGMFGPSDEERRMKLEMKEGRDRLEWGVETDLLYFGEDVGWMEVESEVCVEWGEKNAFATD